MGPRSTLGKYIKRIADQANIDPKILQGGHYRKFILQLMDKLKEADYLVEETAKNTKNEEVPIFRLRINKILWKRGDCKTIKPDPIKQLAYKSQSPQPNPFFLKLYQRDFTKGKRLEAADHTGQLSVAERQDREDRFRAEWYIEDDRKCPDDNKIHNESISALFCSPTMELGVDIGGLSAVHMRNAPPNATNYVQRSGRAGRSGQGALVFTYCSSFSSHDRHYFQHQPDLVAGVVQAPRIELCNEELLATHLNALAISIIGLPGLDTESGRPSLTQLIEEGSPNMPLRSSVIDGLKLSPMNFELLKATFGQVIESFAEKLQEPSTIWYTDDWVERHLNSLSQQLDDAMERWRKMYESARTLLKNATQALQSGHLKVSSKEYKDRKRLQDQATRQLNLLRNQHGGFAELSEFYPYRYLASEGFLPGYNFTRLPLRVFLPSGNTSGNYISRPRAIALREFGPRNIIYHNGSKHRLSQLVVQDAPSSLMDAKISKRSGYFLMGNQSDLEICPFSGTNLGDSANKEHIHDLLEMTESRGTETTRITCEEEERISRGYQIESYFHIDSDDFSIIRLATAQSGDIHLLNLRFIPAARLIHLNRGWRSQKTEGFPIGMTSGNWAKAMPEPDSGASEESRIVKLWTSNLADALYIEPIAALGLEPDGVITLQYTLKRAIESLFQVEEREIGVSAMGDPQSPNIFLYEASEGSLGILSQFVENRKIFPEVIEKAKQICRFDDEQYKAPASYNDLMSYYNQRDHRRLNRFLIQDALDKLALADIELQPSPLFNDYEEQYQYMLQHRDPNSSTEKKFIEYLYQKKLRLPDAAQKRVPGIYCQPDFYYEPRFWVFCDGSPHDDSQVRERDEAQRQLIMARGDEVWSWHYREDLADKIAQRPDIFKKIR